MHKNSSKYLTNPGGVYLENQIKAILHCRSLVWQIQFIRSELMRKFAKISAVLAAMVLALAFAGCSDGGSSSDDVTVGGSSSGSETGGSSGGSGSSSSGNSSGSGSSSSEDSSTKNILAGKTYYSIDFEKVDYTSESNNEAKIRVGMFAFDSNGQKVKHTELAYDFKNGTVNKDNIIEADELDYSVSGSTLTVKAPEGVGEDLIATIKSDGSIDGMKELKGNLYAFAKAEADSKELLAVAYIITVDGTACNLEQQYHNEEPYVLKGTVSGSNLKFTDERKDGQTLTVSGKLSDKEIKIDDSPDGPITLKRM